MEQLILNDDFEIESSIEYKVRKAISRIKTFEPTEGYYLAFSGGKDSIVIKRLADMARVKYDAHYSRTTVDPPELVRYIKEYHSDVIIEKPSITMWDLIPKKKMPPTRRVRYCCDVLKENKGAGSFIVSGVRWAESARRKNTQSMVITNYSTKNEKHKIYLNNDNDEARNLVENCQMKSKHMLNPIIDWTDQDVWEFIKKENLPYCSLYDEGFERLGCIGCPLSGAEQMKKEFKRWPKYKEAYLRAFDRMLEERKKAGLKTEWKTAEEVMEWWLQY